MICPFCREKDTSVVDSRPTEDGTAIRRRRVCTCGGGQRFTTFERVQFRELTVIKKNGRRTPFDREKLAKEFVKQGNLKNKKFFIQIITEREENKSGIYLEQLSEFIKFCRNDLILNIIGLMCIPPINDPPQDHFSLLEKQAQKHNLSHLSMGMSDDYIEAIKHNSTYIRIGTSLFGKRQK